MAMTLQVRSRELAKLLWYSQGCSETAVPYTEFKEAGFEIDFVTEAGNMPECDAKMLTGMTQKLLVGNLKVRGLGIFSVISVPAHRVPQKKPLTNITP